MISESDFRTQSDLILIDLDIGAEVIAIDPGWRWESPNWHIDEREGWQFVAGYKSRHWGITPEGRVVLLQNPPSPPMRFINGPHGPYQVLWGEPITYSIDYGDTDK